MVCERTLETIDVDVVVHWRGTNGGRAGEQGVCLAWPGIPSQNSQAALAASQSPSWRPSTTGELDIMSFPYLLLLSFVFLPLQSPRAQSISTSTPVPPLQWINLTGHFQGPAPPPLKDASIGYDNTTRTLIVFGGESQGGIPQQKTYLCVLSSFLTLPPSSCLHRISSSLNLNTLIWSTPTPQGATSTASPPPRSAAIGGGDFAAS